MINRSMASVLHFISCVQDSCDRHRVCLERSWHQEYAAYLADWKQSQVELVRQAEIKKVEYKTHKDEIAKELEELALADALLKKARSIRTKNEKLINGIVDLMSVPTPDCPIPSSKSANSNYASDKNKTGRRIPQSKSDFIASSLKIPVVPRSKSASVAIVPKNDLKSHRTYSASSRSISTNHIKHVNKTIDCTPVISRKELRMLKGQHLNLPVAIEMQQKQKPMPSDSSGDVQQQQAIMQPTRNEFFRVMKKRLGSIDSAHFKLKLWYPFLSSKSESLLITAKCHKFCSFQRMCGTIHSIQEIMMWIDLLHLVERDIFPNIVYDEEDGNVLRACSYLLSLFQRYSQRIPILDPNG